MVISVTNISESSVNDLFHEAEIFTLNVCHEMEMYNARCEFLNEAESEQKKDSVFKKFIETIKQKAIELFNKAYQSILSIYNNFYAKKNKKAIEKVNSKDVANYMYSKITKNDLVLYDTLNMKVDIDQTNLKTVQDFMDSFKIDKSASKNEIEKAIQGSTNNRSSIKLLNDEKKSFLDDINKQYKDGSISVEEKTAKIKLLMNRYTAELKCQIHNNKTYISVINELIKSGPISDSNEDKSNQSNNSSERKLLTSSPERKLLTSPPESLGNITDTKPEEKSDKDNYSDYSFEKAVESKNYIKILQKIADSLRSDSSGKTADSMANYAEKMIPDLFTKLVDERDVKNNVWETDKSKWNEQYIGIQSLEFAMGCGTREQFNHLKQVAKYVYGNKS